MSERPSIALFLLVVCLAGVAFAIAQPSLITSDSAVEDITLRDASLDSCWNHTAPFAITGRVTYVNDEPVSNIIVSVMNLNTGENFEVRTNTTSNYYQMPTNSMNVSTGDIIRFNASNGLTSSETVYNITADDIGYGGFVRNLEIEFAEPYPDLKITNCSANVVDPENKTLSITYTVKNAGTADAGESDTTIRIDDIPVSNDAVGPLSAGESHSSTVGPLDFPHNSVWITVCADSGCVVEEFNESNNCNEAELDCPLPDLQASTYPRSGFVEMVDRANGRYNICYRISNCGEVNVGPSNATLNITDLINGSVVSSFNITYPIEVPHGSYPDNMYKNISGPFTCSPNTKVVAMLCADTDKEVLESDETNNCYIESFDCPATGKPDLAITDHKETWINRTNRTFEIMYTVKNAGLANASSSTTHLHNSGLLGIEERFDQVPALASGENYTSTVGPFELRGKKKYSTTIKIRADNEEVVNEGNEDNNFRSHRFGLAYLFVHSAWSRWVDGKNKTFEITYQVCNNAKIGAAASNESTLSVYIDGNLSETEAVPPIGYDTFYWDGYRHTIGPFTMPGDKEIVACAICIGWEDGRHCLNGTFGGGACVAADGTRFTCGGGWGAVHTYPAEICKSCTLIGDMYCPKGVSIVADDVVIDGKGFGVLGERSGCSENLAHHYRRSGIRNCDFELGIPFGHDNVTIKNLDIRNFCTGIGIGYADDNRIENCSVHDNGAVGRYTYGISIVNSHNVIIDDCKVYNNTGGIYPGGGGTVCGGHGINFDDGIGDGSSYCSIINSLIFHNYHSGIYAPSTCKCLNITGNRIEDNGYCGELVNFCTGVNLGWEIGYDRTTNSTVSKNLVQSNTGSGIRVAQGYATIADNIVSGCKNGNGTNVTGDGILIDGGRVTFLYNNTVCGNEGADIIDTANESSTFGDDNTCDTTDNYNDEGTVGCIFYCGGANGVCVGKTYNFSCGMVVNESCIFNRSMNCLSNGGLIAGADDIVIDGSGYTIIGDFTGIGIFSNQTNVTVKNLQVKDFSTGIAIKNARDSTIENCNLRKNLQSGINLTADYSTVRNSRIYDTRGTGIAGVVVGGSYNLLLNNTVARNMGYGIYFSPYATNNTINASAIGDNDAGDIFNDETSTNRTNSGYENTCDRTREYWDCSPMGMIYGCTYPWTPPDLRITWKREEWVNHTEKRYNVSYRIKNDRNKSREAYPSTTYLHIDDRFRCIAEDPVDKLGPGDTRHKTFDYEHELSDDYNKDRIWVCADGADNVLENNAADIFYHKIGFGNYTVKELWVDREANNCRPNTLEYIYMPPSNEGAACVADDGSGDAYFCGDLVMKSCTFNGTMECASGPGLIIGADDITIDGNGSAIIGGVTCADCTYAGEEAPCTASGIYNAKHDGVTITDLEIVGFCTGIALKGVSGDPVKGNLIENCDIYDNGFDTGSEIKTHGIHLCYVSKTTIRDNEIYRNKGTGSFCDGGGNGIFIYAGGSRYGDNVITENILHDNDKAGFWCKRGLQHTKITDNEVSCNGNGPGVTDDLTGGIVLKCSSSNYNTIADNIVKKNYGDGIYIGSGENTISYNTVNDNTGNGINMGRSDGSYNNELQENTVCGNEVCDIMVYGPGSGTTGDENTCDTTENYRDDGVAAGCTYLCGKMPDLTITEISPTWVNPDNLDAGYEIEYTMKNIGNADASNISVRIDVDKNPEYDMEIQELRANESSTTTVQHTFTMSEDSSAEIEVCADYNSIISEFDEDNNCMNIEWYARPDLIITRIDVPDKISMFLPNDATAMVANIGTVETKEAFEVELSVNKDPAGTALVKPNLAVGTDTEVKFTWTSALELNELEVFADSGYVIEESDENNNTNTTSVGEIGGLNDTVKGPHVDPRDGTPLEDLIQPGEVNTGDGVGGAWNYDETVGNESASGRAAKKRVSAQLFRSNPFFGAVTEVVVSHSGITVAIALSLLLLFYVGFRGELITHRRNNR
ncbi:MAG: CARDB domain-containing protein [Euryarchaeota archaeon]|nr:CARDB domain-containing protein [Euryarchaeota archaeon]